MVSDSKIKSEEVCDKVTYKYYYDNEYHNKLNIYFDKSMFNEDIKKSQIWKRWYDIHYRCYSTQLHERYPSYVGCSVCEEWNNFNNFYAWYQDNYYEVEGQKMDLDKDILCKGNKIYSPDTCVFVPHKINTMFTNGKRNRGAYPLGVHIDKDRKKYRACIGHNKLGRFNTPEQAFIAYKKVKEKRIKELAKEYKDQIPEKLYQAMLNWKIEITD